MSIGFDNDDESKPADRALLELKAQTRKLAAIEKWMKRIFWLLLVMFVVAPFALFVFNLVRATHQENQFNQLLGGQNNQAAEKNLDESLKALQKLIGNQR